MGISLESDIIIIDKNSKEFNYPNYLIKSNVEHQLSCVQNHLIILLSPISTIGQFFMQQTIEDFSLLKHDIVEKLQLCSMEYLREVINFDQLKIKISQIINGFTFDIAISNSIKDERISIAISYINNNYERVIPVEEIAIECHLSPSRFMHLFKEKAGITYRKAQQWNKISRSFSMLSKQSITKTAYQYGFTDSAHYSKVFKQTFGFNPKSIQKLS